MHPYVHNSTIYNSQDMEAIRCPSADEWIKMWYVYTTEHYTTIKNEIAFAATRMGLEMTTHSEVSQKQTNTM